MRVQIGFWMLLVTAGMAVASPLPPPPDNFASLQYIDGRGCVYERDGGDWVARVDGEGGQICGFPPSLAARRTDPDADRILPAGDQSPPTVEGLLMQQLASDLRQGEFNADPLPPEVRRAPKPPTSPASLQVELGEVLDKAAALRATMTGADGTSAGLCDLLGYQPDTTPRPILGADVTQGLCPGMRAPTPEARILEGARLATGAVSPPEAHQAVPVASAVVSQPVSSTPAPVRDVPATAAQPAVVPANPGVVADRRVAEDARPASPPARTPAVRVEPPATVEMIPANARFVQVGRFTDDSNATLTIRRLSQMGFPVGQTFARKDDQRVRVIMAGPFASRQALVAALNHLRNNGYPKAVAR